MCNPPAVTNQSTGYGFRKGHGVGKDAGVWKDEGLGRTRGWEGHGFSRAAHATKKYGLYRVLKNSYALHRKIG
jgi:hypothetical protein